MADRINYYFSPNGLLTSTGAASQRWGGEKALIKIRIPIYTAAELAQPSDDAVGTTAELATIAVWLLMEPIYEFLSIGLFIISICFTEIHRIKL